MSRSSVNPTKIVAKPSNKKLKKLEKLKRKSSGSSRPSSNDSNLSLQSGDTNNSLNDFDTVNNVIENDNVNQTSSKEVKDVSAPLSNIEEVDTPIADDNEVHSQKEEISNKSVFASDDNEGEVADEAKKESFIAINSIEKSDLSIDQSNKEEITNPIIKENEIAEANNEEGTVEEKVSEVNTKEANIEQENTEVNNEESTEEEKAPELYTVEANEEEEAPKVNTEEATTEPQATEVKIEELTEEEEAPEVKIEESIAEPEVNIKVANTEPDVTIEEDITEPESLELSIEESTEEPEENIVEATEEQEMNIIESTEKKEDHIGGIQEPITEPTTLNEAKTGDFNDEFGILKKDSKAHKEDLNIEESVSDDATNSDINNFTSKEPINGFNEKSKINNENLVRSDLFSEEEVHSDNLDNQISSHNSNISMDVETESEEYADINFKPKYSENNVDDHISSEETPDMDAELHHIRENNNPNMVDLEIVESENDQAFTIKQDYADFMKIDNASNTGASHTSLKDNVNILLNHRKYILKSITTEESTPFTSGILNSELNADYDISVNILKNGHIKFSNISNKHSLDLEYNLLELLQISLSQLPYLKVFLKSNYSTNSLNDNLHGKMNPSALILDSSSGSLWDFENIRGCFSSKSYFYKQNDILKKLNFTAEKDISFLPKSGCILFKNDKNQLVLYNVYKNQVTFLKHKHEKRHKGLFNKVLTYIESPRSDIIDFVVEDGFSEDTVTVLFDSDIAMYHIRKHSDRSDSKFHFDKNLEFSAVEKDDLIHNNILDKKAPVTILALNKVYSDKKEFFYSLLVAKDISKLVYVNVSISDKFEVLGYYEINQFEQKSDLYRGKLNVQTSYIEQQDFYTSFITYKNEIILTQIPLSGNKSELLFSDVVVHADETTVFSGTVYQVEFENDKSTCLSYQTNVGGQFTFYQLHIKNQEEIDNSDQNLEFLNFHISNYIFNKVIDNDGELLSNKLNYQWFASETETFENAFKNQVDMIIQSDEISSQQKINLFENGLNNINVNINTWLTFVSTDFMKFLILRILEHLSTLKVTTAIDDATPLAEESVLKVFKDFKQKFLAFEKVAINFDQLLDFVSKVIYEPLLCGIERQYRCQYFEQLIGSSLYNSVLFSTNVKNELLGFISLTQTLNLEYSEKIFTGLLTVLNVIYYQNHMGINKMNTLVLSIGSILETFKGQLSINEINMLKHLTIINKDWISLFKIYDYLSSTKKIQYSEYPSFFESKENKRVLVNSFLDLYLNRGYKTKLQNFFDIMAGLENTFFINQVYQELISRERENIVTEVLWAFETLINKNYKKAFEVLSEVENNKSKPLNVESKYKDFKEFKSSMKKLLEVTTSKEEKVNI
ncbi:hypothetical protein ACO0OE_003089 [Hanseniaspora uvarum]